jgi:Histidine kinase-like ATPase domain
MTAQRRFTLVVGALVLIFIVVVAVVAAAFAALPVAIAIACAVLALVVGLRSRGKVRPQRAARDPWTAPSAPPPVDGLSSTTTWDTTSTPSAVPALRGRAAAVLTEWDLRGEDVQPSLLVLTELVTNAIEHACPPVHVTLGLGADFVRIEVHDASAERPRSHRREDGHGRGLEIVAGLALRHGWTADAHGKVVWADVALGWPE